MLPATELIPGATCQIPTNSSDLRIRQRLDQHAIDDAEDGRVRADPQGQCHQAIAVNMGALPRPAENVLERSHGIITITG